MDADDAARKAERAACALADAAAARGRSGCDMPQAAAIACDGDVDDPSNTHDGGIPSPPGEALQAGDLRNFYSDDEPSKGGRTHDDSVANESPKAVEARVQDATDRSAAARPAAELAGSGWFPHPGGRA